MVEGRHPLPWKRSESGWLRLEGEPHEEAGEGRIIRLKVGNCIEAMTRGEVAELYRKLGDILLAPYRLIAAGGDRVPATHLDAIGVWLDDLCRAVNRQGWRMQVVTTGYNDAQDTMARWCVNHDVEWRQMDDLDLSIGGNAVALLPCADPWDIIRQARVEHDIPVYRVAGEVLWANPRPSDVASVAHASGGGFVSSGVDFEVVDDETERP